MSSSNYIIPRALANLPQWVAWRYELRNGQVKPTKIPYDPTSATLRKASTTNPRTWDTLAKARKFRESQKLDGVGFVFASTGMIFGIDIDGCVGADGALSDQAQHILAMFPGAYVEHSPSGTGLHILGRGDIQIKGRNRRDLGLEVYTRERFFTVTGQAFYPDRLDLADCAEPFRAFLTEFFPALTTPPLPATSEQPQSTTRSILPDDLALVEKAKAASNGISFSSLWSGDWSGFPSQSEADLALCNALAFWTGRDADRMDRLFRQSGLFRPEKWDRHGGHGELYGSRTIAKAIADCKEVYTGMGEPRPAPTRTNEDLLPSQPEAARPTAGNRVARALGAAVTLETFQSMEIKARPFIIDGLLRQGETGMVFAKTGVGKTFLSLCLAMGATRPGPVVGPYTTVNPCGVLYIDGEMAAFDMQQRINSMAVQADGSRFHLLSSELLATDNQAIPAMDDEWRPAILNWLHEHPDIGLMVLDNLSSLTPGVAEDKRLDWDSINQWLIELRRNGLSVLLVHHAGKGGDQRGTSAREDQLNLTLKLTALEDRKTTAFRVDFQKARGLSGEQKKPFVVELVEDEHGKIDLLHKTVSDETTAQIAFLAVEGLSQIEIRDKTGVSQSGVCRRLKKAEADGLLVVRGAGPDKTYALTDLGRAATLGMDAEAL